MAPRMSRESYSVADSLRDISTYIQAADAGTELAAASTRALGESLGLD